MDPAEETEKGPSEETTKAHKFLKLVKSLLHSSENRTEAPQVGDSWGYRARKAPSSSVTSGWAGWARPPAEQTQQRAPEQWGKCRCEGIVMSVEGAKFNHVPFCGNLISTFSGSLHLPVGPNCSSNWLWLLLAWWLGSCLSVLCSSGHLATGSC